MQQRIGKFKNDLKKGKIFILDGAVGTEIYRRGAKTPGALWSAQVLLKNPQLVKQIHQDYIKAGAQIITTNTFSTKERAFRKVGLAGKGRETTLLACQVARQAEEESGKDVLIAGSVAPLEDCYSPELVPPDDELKKEHLEYAKNLKEGGVDFLLAETMISLREIKAVCEAAKMVGLPLAVSFCCDEKGNLLSGEKLSDAVRLVEKYQPLFLSLNCMSIDLIGKVLKKLRRLTKLPIAIYAQGDGKPGSDQGWIFTGNNGSEKYFAYAKQWLQDGAQIIGGCCGTNPEYISKLTNMMAMMQTLKREVYS